MNSSGGAKATYTLTVGTADAVLAYANDISLQFISGAPGSFTTQSITSTLLKVTAGPIGNGNQLVLGDIWYQGSGQDGSSAQNRPQQLYYAETYVKQ